MVGHGRLATVHLRHAADDGQTKTSAGTWTRRARTGAAPAGFEDAVQELRRYAAAGVLDRHLGAVRRSVACAAGGHLDGHRATVPGVPYGVGEQVGHGA